MSGWVAGAIAVAGIGGALINSNATSNAASAEAGAANNANQLQWNEFQQNQQNMQPWLQAGQGALSSYQQMLGNGFNYNEFADPGTQFQMQMGQDAINRQTANRGGMLAGSTLGALDQFGQSLGSTAYQSGFNRYEAMLGNYGSLAGLGQNTAATLGGMGTTTAGMMGSNLMNAGAGEAAASIANGNNWSGTLNNMGNQFTNYQLMSGLMNGNNGLQAQIAAAQTPGLAQMGAQQYWSNPANTYTGYNGQIVDVG